MFARSVLLCMLPLVFLGALLWVATVSAELVLYRLFLGVPRVWWLLGFVTLLTAGTFLSHFDRKVPNVTSWAAIVGSGVLIVGIFASLHQETGVLCTAAVCPDPSPTLIADTRLGAPLPATGTLAELAIDRRYSSALYFSIVTFTTLGYGDFQPVPHMRVLAATEAVLGYLFLGMFVGALIDLGNTSRSRIGAGRRDIMQSVRKNRPFRPAAYRPRKRRHRSRRS